MITLGLLGLKIDTRMVLFKEGTFILFFVFGVNFGHKRRLIFIESIREIIGVNWAYNFGSSLMKYLLYIGINVELIKKYGRGWTWSASITIFKKGQKLRVKRFGVLNDLVELIKLRIDFIDCGVIARILH